MNLHTGKRNPGMDWQVLGQHHKEEEEKMTLKDCYMQMGADYEGTVQRLRSESLIQRVILKFPQDASYQELCQALEEKNIHLL